MKRLTWPVVACLVAIMLAVRVAYSAGGQTISFQVFTVAQDTYIQTVLLPEENAALCAKYGLAANCTNPQLVAAGCVAVTVDQLTSRNLAYQNCTPFTLNAAGESLNAADHYSKDLLAMFNNDKSSSIVSACNNFKALSAANQNTICGLLGAPVPSTVCNICN